MIVDLGLFWVSEVLGSKCCGREERPRAIFRMEALSKWERDIKEGQRKLEVYMKRQRAVLDDGWKRCDYVEGRLREWEAANKAKEVNLAAVGIQQTPYHQRK